jgi:membrane protease YdiL (CAAX protease family)
VTLTAPPPQPPELPEGADPAPRWPAWYAAVAFLVGLIGTLVAVGIVAAATGTGPDEESATFTVLATFAQNAIFAGTAVLFASMTLRPKAWHFGLRRTRFWPAVGWAALGMVSFYFFAALYTVAVQPDADQQVTESLGADESTLGLIAAGFMVVVVAPAAEEFFFRGFFYKALRTRFSVMAAAVLNGVLFGAIHYDFSGSEALLLVPPLAVLGFVFCLVYEQTGSLYPVIALHALNNSIAYSVALEDAWPVSLAFGVLTIAGCMLLPSLSRGSPRPAPALR